MALETTEDRTAATAGSRCPMATFGRIAWPRFRWPPLSVDNLGERRVWTAAMLGASGLIAYLYLEHPAAVVSAVSLTLALRLLLPVEAVGLAVLFALGLGINLEGTPRVIRNLWMPEAVREATLPLPARIVEARIPRRIGPIRFEPRPAENDAEAVPSETSDELRARLVLESVTEAARAPAAPPATDAVETAALPPLTAAHVGVRAAHLVPTPAETLPPRPYSGAMPQVQAPPPQTAAERAAVPRFGTYPPGVVPGVPIHQQQAAARAPGAPAAPSGAPSATPAAPPFAGSARPASAAPADGVERWVGPARAINGDTLEIGGRRVKLFGVAAPDPAQQCESAEGRPWRCGERAMSALSGRLGDGTRSGVACTPRYRDVEGQAFASCIDSTGADIGAWLVAEGLAIAHRGLSRVYVEHEAGAQAARRGLWQGKFEPPWEWRRINQRS
jgi:endonuclease YncB( thermonuclease family)